MGSSSWVEKKTVDGHAYYYNTSSKALSWDKPDELRSKFEVESESGEWVWIPHPTKLWQPARIVGGKGNSKKCQTQDNKTVMVSKGENKSDLTAGRKQDVQFWPVKLSSLKMPEDDLVMAEDVNEGIITHTLRTRYENNELYTWVGAGRSVLISVNPYKSLPLYGIDQISLHRNKPPNKPLPPHVFGIANDSFDSLLFDNRNQSVLISGESGAGKTEATKQCLAFLAEVAGSEANVEDKILLANPLLEAFGNAKTIRNNNSSRFGKWIQVYFNAADRAICGAEIINYLLEKSRLVHQQHDERNYHVFYQMTQNAAMRSKYSLQHPEKYNYLNQSGCVKVDGIDDVSDFKEMREALTALDFANDEVDWLFRVTAAVLNLGNVTFKAKAEKNNVKGSKVDNAGALKLAAKFLDVGTKALEKVLCYRTISVRGEKSTIPLKPEDARAGCDSLAKGVYGRLFDWLVTRVNDALRGTSGKMVGILDIFGFEIFDNNSFEQLCINFCNEKLQGHFNRTTFKEEEALYSAEGIKFKHIVFIDNQPVLDLIEARPHGILLMLDEECIIPEGSDVKFMTKIEQHQARNSKFQTDTHRRLQHTLAFEIEHYAGVVRYTSDGWLVKNKDTLFQDMYNLCAASKQKLTSGLFPDVSARRVIKSLSNQFRGQLNQLMKVLNETESRYIRCIKPNAKQKADKFNSPMVVDQLRYSGVFEAVEIRRTGYPFRFTFRQFACRYQCVNPHHSYRAKDDKDLCEEIMQVSSQDFKDVQLGSSRVLYRAKEHRVLQLLRNLALETIVPRCQKVIRGHLARVMRRRLLKAEKGLAKALKVANDISMLTKAIGEVPKILGSMSKIFPHKPRNLKAAKKHRDELQKWIELEGSFDRLSKIKAPSELNLNEMIEAVRTASQILHIPRTDRQIMLYDLARDVLIYMKIKVSDEYLEVNARKYVDIAVYGKFRDPKEYASKKMFGKKKLEEGMFTWAKAAPPTSMLRAGDDPAIKKAALFAHKAIRKYMQDTKNKRPKEEVACEVMNVFAAGAVLKVEVYGGLIKQLRNNPDPESQRLGFELMALLLSIFMPDDEEFTNYLIVFLRKNAPNGEGHKYVSRLHSTLYGGEEERVPRAGDMPSLLKEFESYSAPSRFSTMPKRSNTPSVKRSSGRRSSRK